MPLHRLCALFVTLGILGAASAVVGVRPLAGDEDHAKPDKTEPGDTKSTIARERLEIMTSRIKSIAISSPDPAIPRQMQPAPLFRYDDETRGYVDGTVWRLGETGRPLAIITAELHPNYLGGGPRIVYDLLSLTARPFTA